MSRDFFYADRLLLPVCATSGLQVNRSANRDPESMRTKGPYASFSAAINNDYAKEGKWICSSYNLFVTLTPHHVAPAVAAKI